MNFNYLLHQFDKYQSKCSTNRNKLRFMRFESDLFECKTMIPNSNRM
jgi:hypothetical protein